MKNGVPIPWFSPVRSREQLYDLAASKFPLVIKPVDSRGSRGCCD